MTLQGSEDWPPEPPRRPLRWWQWVVFFLPTPVFIGAPFAVSAVYQAIDRKSGFTWLSDLERRYLALTAGIHGVSIGLGFSAICGIIVAVTHWKEERIVRSLVWIVLCAIANLALAWAGCVAASLIR